MVKMTPHFGWLYLLGLGMTLLQAAGCYDPKQVQQFLEEPRQPVSGTEYRVYPPDVITFRSTFVPEVNGQSQQVRPDGIVNMPLLGELMVAGKTPMEIESDANEAARDYYERADVTVQVSAFRSQVFYVFGQVGRTGAQPWTGTDTLLDALAAANPNNLAWWERITLVRPEEPQAGGYWVERSEEELEDFHKKGYYEVPEGLERKKMTINLMAMVQKGDVSQNVLLRPNDVIYVPPTPLAKVGLAIQSLLFPIRPAVEAARVPAVAVP